MYEREQSEKWLNNTSLRHLKRKKRKEPNTKWLLCGGKSLYFRSNDQSKTNSSENHHGNISNKYIIMHGMVFLHQAYVRPRHALHTNLQAPCK